MIIIFKEHDYNLVFTYLVSRPLRSIARWAQQHPCELKVDVLSDTMICLDFAHDRDATLFMLSFKIDPPYIKYSLLPMDKCYLESIYTVDLAKWAQ